MTLLKRYFWRSVLLPSLAIVAIIVGLTACSALSTSWNSCAAVTR